MKTFSLSFLLAIASLAASSQSNVVVFFEPGFPAADSFAAPETILRSAITGAQFASSGELKEKQDAQTWLESLKFTGATFPNYWARISPL